MFPTTNPYFNNFTSKPEQKLIDELLVECIKMYGMDVHYIPRKLVKLDKLFGEDLLSKFEKSYYLEMYFENVGGWEGDKALMSKFGLEINKQAYFIVSRRRFNEAWRNGPESIPPTGYIQHYLPTQIKTQRGEVIPTAEQPEKEYRPQGGDLIYIPMSKDLYEIKYVDAEWSFYQLGKNYTWRITVERFKYGSERMNTGIEAVDNIEDIFSEAIIGQDAIDAKAGNSNVINNPLKDKISDNKALKEETPKIIELDEKNLFGEL